MTKELEQTAVEKLFHKLWDTPKDKFTWYALLKEAKEMEKEQSLKDYQDGYNNGFQIGQMEVIKKGKV